MSVISSINLIRVLDSRGNSTLEATILTENGGFGRAIAPSGASTGEYEAVELPPIDAINAAETHTIPLIEGKISSTDQFLVDEILRTSDSTENFSRIGSNSAVAISMAAAKAAANSVNLPLYAYLGSHIDPGVFPIPLGNIIGGGAHAHNSTHIQEFLAAPIGAPSVSDAIFANAAVHKLSRELIIAQEFSCAKGDEGGWAAPISDKIAFDIMHKATSQISKEFQFEIKFGIDMAASEFYDAASDMYVYGDLLRSPAEQIDYVSGLSKEYSLAYIEDPLHEDDFEGFAKLTKSIGDKSLICGDDLFATNVSRIQKGIELQSANSIIIKPNQIGTLTDTLNAIELAKQNNIVPVISHRSGESEDTTISHIAFATQAPFIKTGVVGGERTAKLNELIRIEQEVNKI